MPQGQVFVDGVGTVSIEEARKLASQRSAGGSGAPDLGHALIPDQDRIAEGGAQALEVGGREYTRALPVIGGLATMHPALRGVQAAMGIPAVMELIAQKLRGEPVDIMDAAGEGAMNAAPAMLRGVGRALTGGGESLVTQAVAGGRGASAQTGARFTDHALDDLTGTAIRENAAIARTIKPGVLQNARRLLGLPERAGYEDLLRRSVDLENQADHLEQQAARAAGPQQATLTQAARTIRQRMQAIDRLIPELQATRVTSRVRASGAAQGLAGAGLGQQAGAVMGAGPAAATAMGAPLGLMQASFPARLRGGQLLHAAGGTAPTLEVLLRGIMGADALGSGEAPSGVQKRTPGRATRR